jgi:hypothetical protein
MRSMLRASLLAGPGPLFAAALALCPTASPQGSSPGALALEPVRIQGRTLAAGQPKAETTIFVLRRELPIPGARSQLVSRIQVERIVSDAEGRFSFELGPWRRAAVWARVSGLASPLYQLRGVPQSRPLELQLEAGRSLSAELLYRRRKPGTELPVRLSLLTGSEQDIGLNWEGTTQADGSLKTPLLPPGSYQLRLGEGPFRLRRPTVLENQGAKATPRIALQRSIRLQGQALAGEGMMARPLAGVRVELLDALSFATAISKSDGSFELGGLEEGPGASILFRADPALGNWQSDVQVLLPGLSPREPAPQFALHLSPARTAKGRILLASGAAARGIRVLARCIIHPRDISKPDLAVATRTDKDGAFELRGLQTRAVYELIAISPQGEAQPIQRIEPGTGNELVRVEPFTLGSRRVLAELSIARGLATDPLELRLYGPKREGRWDRYHSLRRLPDGSYISPGVLPGDYVVFAISKSSGFARATATIRQNEGDAPVRCQLSLAKPRTVQGIVRGPGGKALAQAKVQLVSAGGNAEGGMGAWHDFIAMRLVEDVFPGHTFMPSATTDAQGRFELRCWEGSGKYDLILSGPGEQPSEEGSGIRYPGILGRPNPIVLELR